MNSKLAAAGICPTRCSKKKAGATSAGTGAEL
jgi:hypothetical protein